MRNTLKTEAPGDEIVILMDETRPQTLGVRAIEMSVSAVKVRFATAGVPGLDDVFQPKLAAIVRSVCDGAAHTPGDSNQPDFCVRVNGLTLRGCAVSVTIGETGSRRFRLRFCNAFGNALAVFRISARGETGLALFTPRIISGPEDQISAQKLFEEMLSQLYLPLINLNAYLRHVFDGQVAARGESLSNSVVQLKTRAETLQFAFDRLIAEMMVDKYAATDDGMVAADDAA